MNVVAFRVNIGLVILLNLAEDLTGLEDIPKKGKEIKRLALLPSHRTKLN